MLVHTGTHLLVRQLYGECHLPQTNVNGEVRHAHIRLGEIDGGCSKRADAVCHRAMQGSGGKLRGGLHNVDCSLRHVGEPPTKKQIHSNHGRYKSMLAVAKSKISGSGTTHRQLFVVERFTPLPAAGQSPDPVRDQKPGLG